MERKYLLFTVLEAYNRKIKPRSVKTAAILAKNHKFT